MELTYHCILIAIIKSLIVNSISSSNIHNHMNSRYGIKNMLILIQSKNHLTKLIGINYSKTENKLTILTSILHLSTHPLIMTALCQVPLSFTLNLGFLLWILLKIVTALNINKAHGHEISIRQIKICDEALVKPCLYYTKIVLTQGFSQNFIGKIAFTTNTGTAQGIVQIMTFYNKLTILTSILHLSTNPLIMTALCQVPLSFTQSRLSSLNIIEDCDSS